MGKDTRCYVNILDDLDAAILRYYREGKTPTEQSKILGRPAKSIARRASRLRAKGLDCPRLQSTGGHTPEKPKRVSYIERKEAETRMTKVVGIWLGRKTSVWSLDPADARRHLVALGAEEIRER